MKNVVAVFSMLAMSVAAVAMPACGQQDKSTRPSPPAHASCALPNGKMITVDYSSPRMKGRKIYGGLVPYGQVWRLGANEATTFVTNGDLTAEGKEIPAGSYTIFAVPDQTKWTLIISKKTGEWGIPYPGEPYELGRMEMKASKLPSPTEALTISFDQTNSGCTMNVDWEMTRASETFTQKK